MLRSVFLCTLAAAALTVRAQTPLPAARGLFGTISDEAYVSPTGAFKIAVPVLPELGGQISDTPNVVTFKDDYGLLISIAAFRQDASERWKLQVRGPRDYLLGFLKDNVIPEFKRSIPGVKADNDAVFIPQMMDGALIAYLELPGGSMFASTVESFDPSRTKPAAKRGNMIFVHNGFIFVISTELAERVTEGTAYSLSPDDEKVELRERLADIVHQIQFIKQDDAKP